MTDADGADHPPEKYRRPSVARRARPRQPAVGDHVRVTVVGTVLSSSPARENTYARVRLELPSGRQQVFSLHPDTEVEILETFEDGAVYEDADGVVYRYMAGSGAVPAWWEMFGQPLRVSVAVPKRPLRKLT